MKIIGYSRAGHEFDVRDELKSDGYAATVPRIVVTTSRGKDRKAKLEDQPLLPNYLFLDLTVNQYHALITTMGKYKWLASTFMSVPRHLEASLSRWAATVEAEAQREIDRYRRGEELSLFTKGEAIKVTSGPFAEWLEGQTVTFRRMVQSAHNKFPEVEVETELFGRITVLRADPLHIKRA